MALLDTGKEVFSRSKCRENQVRVYISPTECRTILI